jgi:hypothetical protein
MKSALHKIVLKQFPDAKVVDLSDAGSSPARKQTAGLKKTVSLAQLKSAHVGGADAAQARSTASRRRASAKRKGPSGVVMIAPKNADANARRQAKAVIVSHGKVIALQG